MVNIDPNWPVFVLAGLLVGETYYAKTLVPRVKDIKARYGLPGDAVLHSRSIRRQEGVFGFLSNEQDRQAFYADINSLICGLRVRLYAVVIDKQQLQHHFVYRVNPYNVSLSQLLSVVCGPPGTPSPNRPFVSRIIAESRGKVEDKDLQAEYQRFRVRGLASYGSPMVQVRRPATVLRVFPERVDFARKSRVVAGLELVDLVAYPVGRAAMTRQWDHPAYRVVATKLKDLILFP